jgi:hypothetical protein
VNSEMLAHRNISPTPFDVVEARDAPFGVVSHLNSSLHRGFSLQISIVAAVRRVA